MDIPAFWKSVHAKESELKEKHPSGCLFVTPTNDRARNTCGGDSVETNIETAARMIVTGTAREATAEDIAVYRAHQEENLYLAQSQELRNTGHVKVLLSRAPETKGRR